MPKKNIDTTEITKFAEELKNLHNDKNTFLLCESVLLALSDICGSNKINCDICDHEFDLKGLVSHVNTKTHKLKKMEDKSDDKSSKEKTKSKKEKKEEKPKKSTKKSKDKSEDEKSSDSESESNSESSDSDVKPKKQTKKGNVKSK